MFNISNIKKEIKNIKTVLLIIAHPNDEIMYFTPTIKKLINLGITLKILCLSNGNNEKIDDIRTEEFKKVSKIIKLEDNSILNIPELKDDINQFWNENIVSEKIDDFLKKNNDIQTILTFNEDGVTKHPNHISCFNGLVHFISNSSPSHVILISISSKFLATIYILVFSFIF
jgi:N-acetylglucosaminylphosphatidylinositol deacetylase